MLKAMKNPRVRRLPVVNKAGLLEGIVSLNEMALRAAKSVARKQSYVAFDDVIETLETIRAHKSERKLHAALRGAARIASAA